MLKKLRIKFIVLNMVTVVAVLAVALTAILVLDYQQGMEEVRYALETAISNVVPAGQDETEGYTDDDMTSLLFDQDMLENVLSGELPSGPFPGVSRNAEAEEADGSETADASEATGAAEEHDSLDGTETTSASSVTGVPPQIGGDRETNEQIIPVAVYVLQEDGTLLAASEQNTAFISDEVLAQAAALVADAEVGTGSLSDLGLLYEKLVVGGTTYLAFADASAGSDWKSLAAILVTIAAVAIAVFFVINLFFSRWAVKPVSKAWDQQKQFVADASHDLKTPLTVILANTSIVLEHPERSVASQSQWLESTQHEAESMQGLVNDLLLLARLDAGTTQAVEFEEVDLSDLVEGELLQFESVAFERGIELDARIDPGLAVRGNPTRLSRLASTLLDNACKYAEGRSVDVSLHAQGHDLKLSVHNTGPAIPPEDLPHVFDRFYRADKARTRDESGYGLGLAIALSIAQEHGGELSVTSTEAEGTTFTATLPMSDSSR